MERPASERRMTPCAEFPNDNPELHHGSIWDWVSLCDIPVSELPKTRALAPAVDEKPNNFNSITERDTAETTAAPSRRAAPLQVVSLLTILEGTPRDAGRARGSDEKESLVPEAFEHRPAGVRTDSVPEPVPEAPRAEPAAPIVSLPTIEEEPAARAEAEPPMPIVSLPTIDAESATEAGAIYPPTTALELADEARVPAPVAPTTVAVSDEAVRDPVEETLDDEVRGDGEPIEIVDELAFDDAVDDGAVEETECARAEDPFAQLVSALESVARALGAGDAAIACVDALLGQARLDASGLDERTIEALVAGGVIARTSRGIARSSTFTTKVLAWQGILRGESEDFALPDGGALEPLDEWAADLLAPIVGPPARADGIRRDLRRRGIAAFGLVADAA